jgi:hypothetical protein
MKETSTSLVPVSLPPEEAGAQNVPHSLAHIPLENIISHAAAGSKSKLPRTAGPIVTSEFHEDYVYAAKDHSRGTSGGFIKPPHEEPGRSTTHKTEVRLQLDSGNTKAEAEYWYGAAGYSRKFVVTEGKSVNVEHAAADGHVTHTSIKIQTARNGKSLEGEPVWRQNVTDSQTGEVTGHETYVPMTKEDIEQAKRLVVDAFGLIFKERKPKLRTRLHKKAGKAEYGGQDKTKYPPEIKAQVLDLVNELEASGLKGIKLKRELIKRLHPDPNPNDPTLEQAFRYFQSIKL